MASTRNVQRGERIRALRKDRNLTQQALAHAIQASVRAVQLWEAGGEVSWPNVVQLARVLHVTPEYLLGSDGEDATTAEDQITARLRTLETKISSEAARHDGAVSDAFREIAMLIQTVANHHVADFSQRVSALEDQLRELTLAQQELTTALTRSLLEASEPARRAEGAERRHGPDRRTGS